METVVILLLYFPFAYMMGRILDRLLENWLEEDPRKPVKRPASASTIQPSVSHSPINIESVRTKRKLRRVGSKEVLTSD